MTARRTIPVLLATATLIPVTALGWLSVRILQQDREMERQRHRDSLRYAAGRLALSINEKLAAIEDHLGRGNGIRFGAAGVEALGTAGILYQPLSPGAPRLPSMSFAMAEASEFQSGNLAAAATEYRRLAESTDKTVAAAALVRLGSGLRKQNDAASALEVYARLQRLGRTPVDDQSAELIAGQARCRIYEATGDRERLGEAARTLARVLESGDSAIDRTTFALYQDMLQRWGGPQVPADAVARTETALALWRNWHAGDLPPRGRRFLRSGGVPVLAVWSSSPEPTVVWLAAPAQLNEAFAPIWKEQGLIASVYDPEGELLSGSNQADPVVLSQGETRLPFVLHVSFGPNHDDASDFRGRRTLLLAGLLFTFTLMAAAAYGLYRATAKEMALARQQSEFISTVSHEFRTPLTSMRHLTELLVTNSVPSEERKAKYYELLSRETERLHRMVESLLSFGRMQAGAYAWRLEPADACELVRSAVDEFRLETRTAQREVICELQQNLPPIQADRDALGRAVSNLLENAEKYSEPGAPIRIETRRQGRSVLISVKDLGAGIPAEEQKTLFRRFVRGAEAKRAGTRGIGVGLALVKSVAEAHGGSVQLASEPGQGSTFTLVIPCQES